MFLSINVESLFTFKKHYWKLFIIIIDIDKGIIIKITILVKLT